MHDDATPFPMLEPDLHAPGPTVPVLYWPSPPLAWHYEPTVAASAPQPCLIEATQGAQVEGELLALDRGAGTISVRSRAEGPALTLPFARFRRLTLSAPLQAAPPRGELLELCPPRVAQEQAYALQLADGTRLTGRAVAHLRAREGLYLFSLADDGRSLLRSFVPQAGLAACEFEPSAEDRAAQQWIATPEALLEAVARQQRLPVQKIGQSFIALGLITPQQLDAALAQQPDDQVLGELLVAQGLITRADLDTALAHKMGYALVDLTRFPIDPAARSRVPVRLALDAHAVPLMLDGPRLIVAVDKLSRIARLRELGAVAQSSIVPVLASKVQIRLALSELSRQDAWSQTTQGRAAFFATTV